MRQGRHAEESAAAGVGSKALQVQAAREWRRQAASKRSGCTSCAAAACLARTQEAGSPKEDAWRAGSSRRQRSRLCRQQRSWRTRSPKSHRQLLLRRQTCASAASSWAPVRWRPPPCSLACRRAQLPHKRAELAGLSLKGAWAVQRLARKDEGRRRAKWSCWRPRSRSRSSTRRSRARSRAGWGPAFAVRRLCRWCGSSGTQGESDSWWLLALEDVAAPHNEGSQARVARARTRVRGCRCWRSRRGGRLPWRARAGSASWTTPSAFRGACSWVLLVFSHAATFLALGGQVKSRRTTM